MGNCHEILFYCGDASIPAYYVIDTIEDKATLKNELASITLRIRELFKIGDDIPDRKIHEDMCILYENGLTINKY
jgi:hypothetical protein